MLDRFTFISRSLLVPGLLTLTVGCGLIVPKDTSDNADVAPQKQRFPSVDVAIARQGSLEKDNWYVGTTFPVSEVSVLSRIEGQIIDLKVDTGDRVEQGQVLGKIDNSLDKATVLEAKAELAALQSEVTSLEAEVNRGQSEIEQAKIVLQQAKSDLTRANKLVQEGAISQQSAEQAQNTVDDARQALKSAQQQINNRSSAVVAARQRVVAQEAIVAQEQQRESFGFLISPITGSVLERVLEPGDLARVGDEILQLADFSQIEVRVEISELELGKVQAGQTTRVQLDAFPEETFIGEVTRISLAADTTARLIPVEVTIPNRDRKIGRGLLARVNFSPPKENKLVIPETAVAIATNRTQEISNDSSNTGIIFILQSESTEATVTARKIELGDRNNGLVEVLSGLKPGERFVVRSSRELKEGDRVNLSFLSE